MALITPGPLVGAISGRVGGLVFRAHGAQSSVRIAPRQRVHSGEYAGYVEGNLSYLLHQWNELTESQRRGWRRAALSIPRVNRLGVSSPISGRSLFIKFHLEGKLAIYGVTTYPPPLGETPPPLSLTAIFNSGTYTYNVTATFVSSPSGQNIALYAARTFRTYQTSRVPQWKLIGLVSTALLPYNIYSGFAARWGQITSGEYYHLKATCQNPSSMFSPPITFTGSAL